MGARPYQQVALDAIRDKFRSGVQSLLLKLSTGGGKTFIFSKVMVNTAEAGNRCIMVVRGVQLIEQASQRLFHEKVPHGVIQGSHWNRNRSAKIQLCSIDTLIRRKEFPEAKLVVIDEAHLFTSEKCVEFIQFYRDQGAYILAVTATPWTKDPLTHLADEVIDPISMQGLIEENYLVPPRYFAPSTPDMKGVRKQRGSDGVMDYNKEESKDRMSKLTGDIVEHWRRLGENRSTLCFAVNIQHSKEIVEKFNNAGIPAEHIEGDNTYGERIAAIRRLESGETKVISNVGVFCTGIDIPRLSAIIMARPTASYNLYAQQIGRGTRVHPESGKRDFLVLDHAGNVLRHGFVTDEPPVDLEGWGGPPGEPRGKLCEECFAVYVGAECHACGFEKPPPAPSLNLGSAISVNDGILEEIRSLPNAKAISEYIAESKSLAKERGENHWWIYDRVKYKYGEEVAKKTLKKEKSSTWFIPKKSAPWIKAAP